MKNLEQVRAKNALTAIGKYPAFKGKEGGDVLSGFPALIVNNGLLAALAFSRKKGGGHAAICEALSDHLAAPDIKLLSVGDLDALIKHLTDSDSDQLRLCTGEALAYLTYLKRFV